MFPCKKCATPNSLDSTFCKHCGEPLPEAEVTEAKAKLDALVAEGDSLFAQGRTQEAMLIAEQAVAANPSSARALSLKGMCHERLGQVAEALDCFERVVEEHPDSALDKLKVNSLRNLLVAGPSRPRPGARRNATLAAGAAALLVIAVGVAVAAVVGGRTQKPESLTAKNDPSNLQAFTQSQPQVAVPNANPGAVQQYATQQQAAPQQNYSPQDSGASSPPARDPSGRLPDVGDGSSVPWPGFGGLHPQIVPSNGSDKGSQGNQGDPAPTANSGNGQGNGTAGNATGTQTGGVTGDSGAIQTDADKGHPVVEITLADQHSPLDASGSENVTNGSKDSAIAQVRAARNEYQLGHYANAARMLSSALRSGADPGSTNERLGQCYERLGQKAEAVAAYQRAASAYGARLSAGSGDLTGVKQAMESCQQAIKVLQGG